MTDNEHITVAYAVEITEDDEGGWNVVFSDLPGCFTCGDTREEALAWACEALSGRLETDLQDKAPLLRSPKFTHLSLRYLVPVQPTVSRQLHYQRQSCQDNRLLPRNSRPISLS